MHVNGQYNGGGKNRSALTTYNNNTHLSEMSETSMHLLLILIFLFYKLEPQSGCTSSGAYSVYSGLYLIVNYYSLRVD